MLRQNRKKKSTNSRPRSNRWQRLSALLLTLSASACVAQPPVIEFSADGERWQRGSAHYPLRGDTVHLRINGGDVTAIRWYQIIPDTSRHYKNANHPWEPDPYQWNGFGAITYHSRELLELYGQAQVTVDSELLGSPLASTSPYYQSELGSFWLQVEVDYADGRTARSPGLEASDQRGLAPEVLRLTFMRDRNYLGHLSGFFNVPGVFGSTPYQSGNYLGVDCADVLMAARARWKGDELRDYNVAMMVDTFPPRTTLQLSNGTPDREVSWQQIRPGDFIAVRYPGRRQYQHIGALYEDSNRNGQLDAADLVLHAGPEALHLSALGSGSFDGHVVILSNE